MLYFRASTQHRLIFPSTILLLLTGTLLILQFTRTPPRYIPQLSLHKREIWTILSPEQRRRELVKAFNTVETEKQLGLKLGLGIDVEEYHDELVGFYYDYMTNTNNTDLLDSITRSNSTTSHLPRRIYTTAAATIPHLTKGFQSWTDLNTGWNLEYFSDQGIEEWLREVMGDSKVVEEFHQLKRGVLKADFFRYLIILLQGGLYTDTDTSCLRPIALWPGVYPSTYGLVVDFFNQTRYSMHYTPRDEFMVDLHTGEETVDVDVEDVSDIFRFGKTTLDTGTVSGKSIDGRLEEPPRLVVAIEKDAIAEHVQWKGSDYTRGLQVHQWTLLAQPYHPVFLDSIYRIIKTSQLVRDGMPDPGALDYTGPSMFSDAVFRYLLVEYGVHPQQLIGLKVPMRIGDVLVLPRGSFQAPTWRGYQGENRLVYHGNHGESVGSWKEEEGWKLRYGE